MGISGDKIKKFRINRGLTQRQLSEKSGVIETTIRKYELGKQNPKTENLQKIATALGVPIYALMDEPEATAFLKNCFWTVDLEEKLKQVGCSVGAIEAEGYLWINYPDGTLEVTEEELKELHESTESFIKFKLDALKHKHANNFRPN